MGFEDLTSFSKSEKPRQQENKNKNKNSEESINNTEVIQETVHTPKENQSEVVESSSDNNKKEEVSNLSDSSAEKENKEEESNEKDTQVEEAVKENSSEDKGEEKEKEEKDESKEDKKEEKEKEESKENGEEKKEADKKEKINELLEEKTRRLDEIRKKYVQKDTQWDVSKTRLLSVLPFVENSIQDKMDEEMMALKKEYQDAQKEYILTKIDKEYEGKVTPENIENLSKEINISEFAKLDKYRTEVKTEQLREKYGEVGVKAVDFIKKKGEQALESYKKLSPTKKILIGAGIMGVSVVVNPMLGMAGAASMRGLSFASMYKGYREGMFETDLEEKRLKNAQETKSNIEKIKEGEKVEMLKKFLIADIENTHKKLQQEHEVVLKGRRNATMATVATMATISAVMGEIISTAKEEASEFLAKHPGLANYLSSNNEINTTTHDNTTTSSTLDSNSATHNNVVDGNFAISNEVVDGNFAISNDADNDLRGFDINSTNINVDTNLTNNILDVNTLEDLKKQLFNKVGITFRATDSNLMYFTRIDDIMRGNVGDTILNGDPEGAQHLKNLQDFINNHREICEPKPNESLYNYLEDLLKKINSGDMGKMDSQHLNDNSTNSTVVTVTPNSDSNTAFSSGNQEINSTVVEDANLSNHLVKLSYVDAIGHKNIIETGILVENMHLSTMQVSGMEVMDMKHIMDGAVSEGMINRDQLEMLQNFINNNKDLCKPNDNETLSSYLSRLAYYKDVDMSVDEVSNKDVTRLIENGNYDDDVTDTNSSIVNHNNEFAHKEGDDRSVLLDSSKYTPVLHIERGGSVEGTLQTFLLDNKDKFTGGNMGWDEHKYSSPEEWAQKRAHVIAEEFRDEYARSGHNIDLVHQNDNIQLVIDTNNDFQDIKIGSINDLSTETSAYVNESTLDQAVIDTDTNSSKNVEVNATTHENINSSVEEEVNDVKKLSGDEYFKNFGEIEEKILVKELDLNSFNVTNVKNLDIGEIMDGNVSQGILKPDQLEMLQNFINNNSDLCKPNTEENFNQYLSRLSAYEDVNMSMDDISANSDDSLDMEELPTEFSEISGNINVKTVEDTIREFMNESALFEYKGISFNDDFVNKKAHVIAEEFIKDYSIKDGVAVHTFPNGATLELNLNYSEELGSGSEIDKRHIEIRTTGPILEEFTKQEFADHLEEITVKHDGKEYHITAENLETKFKNMLTELKHLDEESATRRAREMAQEFMHDYKIDGDRIKHRFYDATHVINLNEYLNEQSADLNSSSATNEVNSSKTDEDVVISRVSPETLEGLGMVDGDKQSITHSSEEEDVVIRRANTETLKEFGMGENERSVVDLNVPDNESNTTNDVVDTSVVEQAVIDKNTEAVNSLVENNKHLEVAMDQYVISDPEVYIKRDEESYQTTITYDEMKNITIESGEYNIQKDMIYTKLSEIFQAPINPNLIVEKISPESAISTNLYTETQAEKFNELVNNIKTTLGDTGIPKENETISQYFDRIIAENYRINVENDKYIETISELFTTSHDDNVAPPIEDALHNDQVNQADVEKIAIAMEIKDNISHFLWKDNIFPQMENIKISDLNSDQKQIYDDLKFEIGKIVGHDPIDYKAQTIDEFFSRATQDVIDNHSDKIQAFKDLFKIKK